MSSPRVRHPQYRAGAVVQGPHGVGGPAPVDPTKQKPINPPLQIPNPLDALSSALSKVFGDATITLVSGGQVALGVVLVAAGLLLAVTGRIGPVRLR